MSIQLALAARKGRGKDTFVEIAREIVPDLQRVGFADALKDQLFDMVNFFIEDRPWTSTERKHLKQMLRERETMGLGWQWWGEFRRQLDGEDYWVNRLDRRLKAWGFWQWDFVVADLRHDNEAVWCHKNNILVVRIEGPDHRAKYECDVQPWHQNSSAKDCDQCGCSVHLAASDSRSDDHPSELYVDNLHADRIIHNDGSMMEYRNTVHKLLHDYWPNVCQ